MEEAGHRKQEAEGEELEEKDEKHNILFFIFLKFFFWCAACVVACRRTRMGSLIELEGSRQRSKTNLKMHVYADCKCM